MIIIKIDKDEVHNNIYGKTFSKIKKKKARDLTFKLVFSQYKIKVQGRE